MNSPYTPETSFESPRESMPKQEAAEQARQSTHAELSRLFEETQQSEVVQAVLASSGLERSSLFQAAQFDRTKYPVGANRYLDQAA